jgi:hypothetical protein
LHVVRDLDDGASLIEMTPRSMALLATVGKKSQQMAGAGWFGFVTNSRVREQDTTPHSAP